MGRLIVGIIVAWALGDVLRTLRNGFAHSHWVYGNLSALDCWRALGWKTTGKHARLFDLENRPAKNYAIYVADAPGWNTEEFWSRDGLRILVTPSHVLRYHLHLMLNYTLNASRTDVFGNVLSCDVAPMTSSLEGTSSQATETAWERKRSQTAS